jgi:hypothetical protein
MAYLPNLTLLSDLSDNNCIHVKHIKVEALNVITLGQSETENINRMITISKRTTYKRVILVRKKQGKFDHIN